MVQKAYELEIRKGIKFLLLNDNTHPYQIREYRGALLQTKGMEEQAVHSYFFDAAFGNYFIKMRELRRSRSKKERSALVKIIGKNLGFMEEAVNSLDEAGIDTTAQDKLLIGCRNTFQKYKNFF